MFYNEDFLLYFTTAECFPLFIVVPYDLDTISIHNVPICRLNVTTGLEDSNNNSVHDIF